jgi:hypothetical protein
MLPPLTPDEPPKGMAEGRHGSGGARHPERDFDATGRRFRSLPVTGQAAQGSFGVTRLSLTINGRAHGPVEVRDELSMNDFCASISA